MKGIFSKRLIIFIFLCFTFSVSAQIAGEKESDKTLSPYFFVKSEDPSVDQLPLKETSVEVNIAGVIADIKVAQVYKNEGTSILEAIYVFPASTRAAVYNMKMTIGERIIQAKIEKKKEARREYEQALAEGKTASLLEQQRPNVFQMNVGNILPGDEIKVELYYTELLIAEDKTYEFVYPTVVGPRYSNQTESEAPVSDLWIKNPYLKEGELPAYTFNINVGISAGMPIRDIVCTSHKVDISYQGEDRAVVGLPNGADNSGNRDFILKYRLTGKSVEPGLLIHQGDKENFFLMMLQPPKRVQLDQIPPREYIFIVDVSGSMNGFPLDISKDLLRDLIGNLQKGDRFNVILFAAGSSVLSEVSLAATQTNINKAIRLIEKERGGGGTELLPALKRALALPGSIEYSRTVIIATDGYVSVEKEVFELIRDNLGQANMFAFGIGSSVNRFLIEGMSRAGMGESFIVTKPGEAQVIANKFRKYISSPVLTGITYKFNGFETYDVEPQAIPDVLAERPVMLFGKWRGKAKGQIEINGYSGGGKRFSKRINLSGYEPSDKNAALKFLWARYRITMLTDYNQLDPNDERVNQITNLGLSYNILTDYTSFLAVDSEVRSQGKPITTIHQPLPLPQGVSNYAVGAASGGFGWKKSRGWAPVKQSIALDQTMNEKVELSEIKTTIELEKVIADGEQLEKIIRGMVILKIDDLNQCYQRSSSFGISGKITAKIVVNKKGDIANVFITSNDLIDKNLERCLIATIRTWQLASKSEEFKDTSFTCEFKFSTH